ncbi:MAG: hypothetical protein IPH35_27270 [Rhodoferax sp.]|nr:hypothetical protein [Rhodoferax sp.]
MSDLKSVRDFLQSPFILAAMETPVAVLFLVLIFAISPDSPWAGLPCLGPRANPDRLVE